MQKILIVEDEIITAMQMQETLEKKGYEVSDIVDNAKDALSAVQLHKPDLILTDINIKGGVDGIEFANNIHINTEIPIVFITAYFDDETIESSMQSKPNGYITKPFTSNELYAAVKIALMQSKKATENTEKEIDSSVTLLPKNCSYIKDDKKLFIDEKEVLLTKNESLFLYILFQNKNSFVPTKDIEEEIWKDKKSYSSSSLRTLVYRLRTKLPDCLIDISYGQGYRLNTSK